MTSHSYRTKTWIDPRQEFRASPIQGIGAFARVPIKQGEVVEILGGVVMTEGEFRAFVQTVPRFNAIQIDEQLHLVEFPEVTMQRGGGSLNHACDSSLWFVFPFYRQDHDSQVLTPRRTNDHHATKVLDLPAHNDLHDSQCSIPLRTNDHYDSRLRDHRLHERPLRFPSARSPPARITTATRECSIFQRRNDRHDIKAVVFPSHA